MFLDVRLYFFSRSCALFTGFVSTLFRKKKFKIKSPSIIHIFKNYFATVFSIFNKISSIQVDF